MDSEEKPGKLANEVAFGILCAIYGPDLIGCRVSSDALTPLIQQALDAHAKKEETLNGLFVQVLEKIQLIATPPDRSQIKDAAHLASILGERADAILEITSKTLQAWEKLKSSNQPSEGM